MSSSIPRPSARWMALLLAGPRAMGGLGPLRLRLRAPRGVTKSRNCHLPSATGWRSSPRPCAICLLKSSSAFGKTCDVGCSCLRSNVPNCASAGRSGSNCHQSSGNVSNSATRNFSVSLSKNANGSARTCSACHLRSANGSETPCGAFPQKNVSACVRPGGAPPLMSANGCWRRHGTGGVLGAERPASGEAR